MRLAVWKCSLTLIVSVVCACSQSACDAAGGSCETPTPGVCLNGVVGTGSEFSCGGGDVCCLPLSDSACEKAGGACIPNAPGACADGTVGDPSAYSCGNGSAYECCLNAPDAGQ